MSLFVNGEWFNTSLNKEEQPPAHRRFKEEYDQFVEESKSFKFPVTLRIKRAEKIRTDARGTPLPPPSDNLSWRSTIRREGGSETWVYQKRIPDKVDGEYVFFPISEWIRGSLRLSEKQMDKLFYYMKKSASINNQLIHYDPAARAREKAKEQELKGQLYFLVYNSESPLVQDTNSLKDVARSWGVRKVGDLSIAEIQEELFNKVTGTRGGMQKFVGSVQDKRAVGKKSKIREAVEKEIIVFNPSTLEWKFKTRGKETSLICKIDESDRGRAEDTLMTYLERHPMEENRILYAIKTGKLSEFTPEDVENLDWETIKTECEIAGIRTFGAGRKKEVVMDELRDYLRFLQNVKK